MDAAPAPARGGVKRLQFDVLGSADFLVPSRAAAVAAAQSALGFPAPRPQWSSGEPGRGFSVTFMRPHKSLAVSPTLLEIIAVEELAPDADPGAGIVNIRAMSELQGDRPVKTHGVVVGTSQIEEIIERIRSDGRRHWIHYDALGIPRVWMGATEEDPCDYRPDDDAGLLLEFVPTPALRLWPETFEGDPGIPDDVGPGGLVRLASRCFLVAELDKTVDLLGAAFGWQLAGPVEKSEDGSRRARMAFSLPQSAWMELLEPAPSHPDAEALARWGTGVWQIRIGVNGLAAKAEDLRSRGTPFAERVTGFERPPRVLRVDSSATPGCLFEFAEFEKSRTT